MTDFAPFSRRLKERFDDLSKHELFTTLDGDALWAAYLAAFPEGTNPIFRERTEHDCSCCRNFIKNLGGVVAIVDGDIETVWDVEDLEYPYNDVADRLHLLVRNSAITGLFRSDQRQHGAEFTIEALADGGTKKWNHFVGRVAPKHQTPSVAQVVGDYATTVGVFKRGLEELKADAFVTVLELIDGNALYRGAEFRESVAAFQALEQRYAALPPYNRHVFLWSGAALPVARFRNTAIGTLLVDLSEGRDLEGAVASFEQKVAPTNYKRTSALITPRMVNDALATIAGLGLEPALERRFAKLSDVSVNNVIWVDNGVQSRMRDGIAGKLLQVAEASVAASKLTKDKGEPISIADFMANVVPGATGMEVFLANGLQNNLMSLTAPVHAEVEPLFKWSNNFAWSYNGNITDSIKERVKRAGGNTGAKLRVSLAWFNGDDLDIHAETPVGHIYFGNKAGTLDVDMNAHGIQNQVDPVENLSWTNPRDGKYRIIVVQFNKRSNDNPGFVVELEHDGQVSQFSYTGAVANRNQIAVMSFEVRGGQVVNLQVGEWMKAQGLSQEAWGVSTEQFVKVNTLMFSPNHWDEQAIGNKHWLFLLDGCRNPEPTRGIYNEYLRSDLEKHRKVFEVLGAQTMCPVVDEQLSGLGFSSTKGDSVLVRVDGRKTYQLNF